MAINLLYGPSGSGKTRWAEAQANDQVKVVSFYDAYQRCRSSNYSWKPRPSFFQGLSKDIKTLIIDEAPPLHTVKWQPVYHALSMDQDINRIYLSQTGTAHLPLLVKVYPFSPDLQLNLSPVTE